jgi:outer membrane protein assembly factor BamB
MAAIELGCVSSGDDSPVAPTASPYRRRSVRRVAAALVAVLCLATAVASAVPEQRGLRPLWETAFQDGDNFIVAGDSVFVLRDGAEQVLTAYALADGGERWSRTLPYRVAWVSTAEAAGVLLLPTGERLVKSSGDDFFGTYTLHTQTLAIDASTGGELWRSPGELSTMTRDTSLLADYAGTGSETARLRLVRNRDGATLWAHATPRVEQWTTFGPDESRPERVATVTGTGQVEVFRFADGAGVSEGTVRWRRGPMREGVFAGLLGHAGALVVSVSNDERSTVTAYAADTLRPLWQADGTESANSFSCGTVLCLGGGRDHDLRALDWTTGAVRWQRAGPDFAMDVGAHRLLAYRPDQHNLLLDEETGRVVIDLGYGTAAVDPATGATVMLAPTRSIETAVSLLRSGELFLLGRIRPLANGTCLLKDGFLVCSTGGRRLAVTAVG